MMCIPATLPAAFLAFNQAWRTLRKYQSVEVSHGVIQSQVFLSAEPDHWCSVPELMSANLTLDHIKALSIPQMNFGPGAPEHLFGYV